MTRPMLALLVAVAATAGPFSPLAQADAQKPTFDDDIKPLLALHCGSCHSNDKQKGGLNLATFAATMTGGSSGAVVAAGNPDKSRLYTLSAHIEEPKMPPMGNKLEPAKLDLIKKWVEQGARENAGSKAVAMKPKADIGLASVTRGRPAGPPPMPGKLPLDPLSKARRPGAVLALAASPWAPVIAVGGQKQIFLVHADTGEPLGTLPFPHGQINSLKFSRSGKLLLAAGGRGGQAGKATLYDLATGKVVTEVGIETDAILSADISADQTQIAVGSPSKLVRVYSTADGSVIREIKKHTDWVTAVEYSADGVLLGTGDRNGGLFVWEAFTGREYFSLRGHTAAITDISWRDDSNALATSSEDTTIRLWEMENGNPIKSWGAHGGGASSVRYTHDNRLVSTGRDKLTKVWDQNGAAQKQFEALPDLGLRAAVSHDNLAVFAGDWSGVVKGWTIADAKVRVAADTNPPTAAERVAAVQAAATAAIAAAEAKLAAANAAVVVAKANADKANAELVPVQKLVGDAVNAANAAKAAVAPAKVALDQQTAALTGAQAAEAAKTVTAQALTEAAGKVQAAANAAPQNGALKAEAAKLAEVVKVAGNELIAAKAATVAAVAAVKAATDKHAATAKTAGDTAVAQTAAQQKLTADTAARKPALDAAATAQAAVAAATAEVAAAKAKLAAVAGKK